MSQYICNGRVLIALLLYILQQVTLTYADACESFCNRHRPTGSSEGYTTSCRAAVGRNWEKISHCSRICVDCNSKGELACSKGTYECPPVGLPTYLVILIFFATMFACGALMEGAYMYRKYRKKNQVGVTGRQSDVQEPATELAGGVTSTDIAEPQDSRTNLQDSSV